MLLLPNFQRTLIILSFLYLYSLSSLTCYLLCYFCSLSASLSFFASHLFDWGCKGKSFHHIASYFFFFFHNFFFTFSFKDFVAIFCKELRSNRAAKISSFLFHFQTFSHLFLSLSPLKIVLILLCSWWTFVCKELLWCVLFCKAGRKDRRV